MNKALIVIDLQNDYFCGGTMELKGVEEALKNTNKLISYARENAYNIYFIQHLSLREGASFFVPNTKGVELHKNLNKENELVIEKHYPNSFRETNLQEELKKENVQELIICGAMSHMCIDSTVRAGFDLGYSVVIVKDACATKDLTFNGKTIASSDVHGSFMSALGSVFAKVVCTESLIK